MAEKRTLVHNPLIPYDPDITQYGTWTGGSDYAMPWVFTSWQEETLSWKESCYLGADLAGQMCDNIIEGPDAARLLSDTLINGFDLDKFPVGKLKHGIAVSPQGHLTCDGLIFRDGENKFTMNGPEWAVIPYIEEGGYDVKVTLTPYETFMYQLAGPRSLEVIEHAFKKDLHDLGFLHFQWEELCGHTVRVCRVGMGGTLSYEVHGPIEAAEDVYNALYEAGKPFGIKRLGQLAYMCNHTENGFPQCGTHFMYAMAENPVLAKYFSSFGDSLTDEFMAEPENLRGSMAEFGADVYHTNPFELGWGKMINWNHDFVGKEALLKMKEEGNTRTVCTLVWNPEDILKVIAANYDDEPGIPDQFTFPQDYFFSADGNLSDKLLDADGNLVGRSAGIVYTLYYKKTISLGFIPKELNVEGTELTLIWGTPGTRQFPIRVTVSRYPFLDLADNRSFDIESIPRYGA